MLTTRVYPMEPIERLGEWLVRRSLIARSDLFLALDVVFRHGCRLGDALVWLELMDRAHLEAEARRFAAFSNRTSVG